MLVNEQAVQAAQNAYRAHPGDSTESHRAALTAALPFLTGVKVKELTWLEPSKETNGCWIAKCEIGTYSVVNENGWYAVLEEHAWGVKGFEWISNDLSKDTRQTAFDAAQADYEARILSAIEVDAAKPDPWVDTRLVRFDDTIAFGHGGFDFDRWESLRWEMHTRHGSFAVWKSDSKTWSMYGGKYGFLMLDRFSSEAEAKAEAEQIVISLDAEPSPRAQALEEAAKVAESFGSSRPLSERSSGLRIIGRWEGEQSASSAIATSIRALSSQPVAGAGKTVDELAAYLCDEFDFDLNPVQGASWPEHENDEGKREGGYVRLQPSDVQTYARENAKRILAFLGLPASPGASE